MFILIIENITKCVFLLLHKIKIVFLFYLNFKKIINGYLYFGFYPYFVKNKMRKNKKIYF